MTAARFHLVVALAAIAALRPALQPGGDAPGLTDPAVVWPTVFENVPLVRAPLLATEERFAQGFPGATAAFDDGHRRVVMRWITQATRKVHPIEACLRAGGFAAKTAPAVRYPHTGLWGVLRASKNGRTYLVREHIVSADGTRVWTDVSAWYWAALTRPRDGPWLAITVIERAGSTAEEERVSGIN